MLIFKVSSEALPTCWVRTTNSFSLVIGFLPVEAKLREIVINPQLCSSQSVVIISSNITQSEVRIETTNYSDDTNFIRKREKKQLKRYPLV